MVTQHAAVRPLAILAGGGEFPLLVARAAVDSGRPVLIAGIRGEASSAIESFPHIWIYRGQLGRLFGALQAKGIGELVMIGGIRERRMPYLSEIDLGGIWSVLTNWRMLRRGDDSVLRIVARLIEARGFRVVGAAEIAPHLTVGEGVHTAVAPGEADHRDIKVGIAAATTLGVRDKGQAAVARHGVVIATETASGTDAMLASVATLTSPTDRPVGVLVKCLKPNQDPRLDMPAIGLETVERAAEAGLRGIAVSAGTTLVTDLKGVIAALDQRGMYLVGIDPSRTLYSEFA